MGIGDGVCFVSPGFGLAGCCCYFVETRLTDDLKSSVFGIGAGFVAVTVLAVGFGTD